MKALISPNELARTYDGSVIEPSQRIAQISGNEFPVALPLFWVDWPENYNPEEWYYLDGQFLQKPLLPPSETNLNSEN